MNVSIGGVTIDSLNISSFNTRSPKKDQSRSRSLDGLKITTVTKSYTHRYTLKLQSLSADKYRELYSELISLDTTADGKITLETKGEIRAGIVHLPFPEIPATMEFDFSMDGISPDPKVWYNMSLPLSIFVAVC